MTCIVCGGGGWTSDPTKTHVGRWEANDLLRYPVVRAFAHVPEGTPPLPCLLCNKTQPERYDRGSAWLPYYPRWERDADGDRTSSIEWRTDPRSRMLVLNGYPVRPSVLVGVLEKRHALRRN